MRRTRGRWRSTVAGLTLAAAVVAPLAAGTRSGAVAVRHDERSACTGVHLWTFRFEPSTVAERHTTTLLVTVRDCTTTRFVGTVQTSGRLVCLVVDPLVRRVDVAPGGTETRNETFVAPSCVGSATIDGRLATASGHEVAHRAATVQVVAAG